MFNIIRKEIAFGNRFTPVGVGLSTYLTFALDENGFSDDPGYRVLTGELDPLPASRVLLTLDKAVPEGVGIDAYVYVKTPGSTEDYLAWWVPTKRLSATMFEAAINRDTVDRYSLECIFLLRVKGYAAIFAKIMDRLCVFSVPGRLFFPQAVRACETRPGQYEGSLPAYSAYEIVVPAVESIDNPRRTMWAFLSTAYESKNFEQENLLWDYLSDKATVHPELTAVPGSDEALQGKLIYRLTLFDSPDFPGYIILPEYSEFKTVCLQLPPNGGRIYAPPGQYFVKRK